MTRGGIYCEIYPELKANPKGGAKGIIEGSGYISPSIPIGVIIKTFSISKSCTSSIVLPSSRVAESWDPRIQDPTIFASPPPFQIYPLY